MEGKESNWENELVLHVLDSNLLSYFNSQRDTNPQTLFNLILDFVIVNSSKVIIINPSSAAPSLPSPSAEHDAIPSIPESASTQSPQVPPSDLKSKANIQEIFISHVKNSDVIRACAILSQQKEEFYKSIVQIDEMLAQGAFEIEFSKESASESNKVGITHNALVKSTWKGYNILHFDLFLALGRCKIWPRLFKEICVGKKKERTWTIHTFFESFRNSFNDIVKLGFNKSVISKKHQKDIEKETIKSLSNNVLIQALRDSNTAELTLLLEEGADINSIDGKEKVTVAHLACDFGSLDMVRLLDKFKCNWEIEDAEKMTPLFYAMRGENIDVLRFLIEEKKVNIEHEEFMQRTPFYWACCLGNLRIIRFMVESGANINAKTKLKRTALSKACFLGRADVVKYLLSQPSIDFESGDSKGRNPLHNAIFGPKGGREGKKVVPSRLNLPVNSSLTSSTTDSAEDKQVGTFGKDCPEAAQYLLEKGANVDALDIDDSTPLHVSCSSEALDSIPLLIAFGADINRQNKFGDTPLHYASKFGHISTVKLLLEGYEVKILNDSKGHTPFDTALVSGQLKVYEYLLQKLGRVFYDSQPPSAKSQHLLRIIESATDKNQRVFLNLFIEHALREDDFAVILDDALVLALPSLRDLDSFNSLTKRCKALEKSDELITSLVLAIVKARRIDLLSALHESFKSRFSDLTFSNQNEIIECVLNYNDKEIVAVLFMLNVDVVSFKSSILGTLQNSFLHEIVGRRKTGVITNFAKVIGKKYPLAILRNKYLLDLQSDMDVAQSFVMRKNEMGLTCVEQSMILKFFDIFTILEQMCVNYFHFGKKLVDFSIPEFEIVDLSKTSNVIDSSTTMSSSAETLTPVNTNISTEKTHTKRDLLEQINQQIEESNLVSQFDISSHENDQEFSKQIISLDVDSRRPLIEKIKLSAQPSFIDTPAQLAELVLPNLHSHRVIGIDLEYWLDNSDAKVAFICTMQLSTISGNFVIDVLKIRDATSAALKDIFESPNHVKVFHGGETDLKLLKKDLDLNLVNIFDTAKAYLKANETANSISLQALCSHYLATQLDKSFQTSDWRIRPLPNAMFHYAINDSLLTLMLFFVMKHELTHEELKSVAMSCNRMCFRQLEKSTFDFHKIYVLKDTGNTHN